MLFLIFIQLCSSIPMLRSGSFGEAGTSASHSAQRTVGGKVQVGTKRPHPFANSLDGNVARPRLDPIDAFKTVGEINRLGRVKSLVENRNLDPFIGLKLATDFKTFKYLLTETRKTKTLQQVLDDASIDSDMLFKATVADNKLPDAAAVLNARPTVNPLVGLSDEMSESSMKFVFRKYFEKNTDDIPNAHRALLENPYVDKVFLFETAFELNRNNLVREIIKDAFESTYKNLEMKRLLLEKFYAGIGDENAAAKQLLEIPSINDDGLFIAAQYSNRKDLAAQALQRLKWDQKLIEVQYAKALGAEVTEGDIIAVKKLLNDLKVPATGQSDLPLLYAAQQAAETRSFEILDLLVANYKSRDTAIKAFNKFISFRSKKESGTKTTIEAAIQHIRSQ